MLTYEGFWVTIIFRQKGPKCLDLIKYDEDGSKITMERKNKHLCSPITVGRVTFRNRMFSTPMGGTDIENDGCIGPKSTAFYEYRAKGGAAAVTVSELMVHPATDGSHAYHLAGSVYTSLARATDAADASRRRGAIRSV